MQKITVEAGLQQKLSEATGQTLFCDAEGHAIGIFSPIPGSLNVNDLRLEPPLSIAETEELRKDKTGKPLEEILNRLGL
jgi:hypothetical protein